MELDRLKLALDEVGTDYKESGVSLVVKDCPACGSSKYKVHFRAQEENGLFFGRCFSGSCQTNYSSFKYLLLSGMPYGDVLRFHGGDAEEALKLTHKEKKKEEVPVEPPERDISKFFYLKDWKNHPATRYAISRGVQLEWQHVMIDTSCSAVVFVIYENNEVVGFQKRFIEPESPRFKTKNSKGLKKDVILEFPREGADILVCEGPFSAVAAWHFGYHGVCTFGSSVSDPQIQKIAELSEKNKVNIGIAFDMDDAGKKGMKKIRSGLFWRKKETFLIEPEVGNDLNDSWMARSGIKKIAEKYEYDPTLPEIKFF